MNREEFSRLIAARESARVVPEPFRAFYHVGCMNHWRPVVREQLALAAHVGLCELHCVVLGSVDDEAWCQGQARERGVSLATVHRSDDLGEYETPTLAVLHGWATANPTGAALYWHTKGVSATVERDKRIKDHWRRLMQRHVVAQWRENIHHLAVFDIAGVAWQHVPDFPHFSGNFWLARNDWIAGLDDPRHYRTHRMNPETPIIGPHKWARMHAEMWLGSKTWHHVKSLYGGRGILWTDDVFRHSVDIPGFTYPEGA